MNNKYGEPLPKYESDFIKKQRLSVHQMKLNLAPHIKFMQNVEVSNEYKYFGHTPHKSPSALFTDMTKLLLDGTDLLAIINETSVVLKEATNSVAVTVYMVDDNTQEIYQITRDPEEESQIRYKISTNSTVAAYVAATKEFVKIDDALEDIRFSDSVENIDITIKSILCVPIVTPENDCLAVFELYRDEESNVYDDKDIRLVIVTCGWMGSTIYQNQQRLVLQKQQELNEYLLDLSKCYFGDAISLEKLITELVNFAKIALNAEHGLFYIMNQVNDQLFADLYEEGIGKDTDTLYRKCVKVKFISSENDLLSEVVMSGETINIKNAYKDARIVQDKRKGYTIKSVLCMPIKGVNEILGMVQILNKKKGFFTKSDEVLLQTFSVYCSFILSYTHLNEKMTATNNMNSIHSEMLIHHMQPCIHDYYFVHNHPEVPTLPDRFNHFDFYIPDAFEHYMPQLLMYMYCTISEDIFENISLMAKYVLVVQKCYHNHPYHNFHHAFNVCHCIYNMLLRNKEIFTPFELKAFLIASYCHDIDHYGVTNNFLEITNHYLAQLYEESVLENHHYHVTEFIIKFMKLFKYMPQEEYKAFLNEIKQLILATDLSLYFKRRGKIYQIATDNLFSWNIDEHRTLFKSVMMTMADLSGLCKPFHITKLIIDKVYKEFYNEGDKEKEMGLCPLSIMDREKVNMIPADQVQFVTVVALPCAFIIATILPNCSLLHEDALKLRDMWQEIQDSQEQEVCVPENTNV